MVGTAKWTAAQMPSQAGKTALVTGANSGIGYQTALELARHGAHVLLGCRSQSKGAEALEGLKQEIPGASVELAILDLASLASVRTFAVTFLASSRALDLLVNNAGVMAPPTREATVDGFEKQMATNHLGHFALTGLLLPSLKLSAAPRVVTVASLAHLRGRIDFDNLQSERVYHPRSAYAATKLANLLFAKELDRRASAAGLNLLSVAAHPGLAKTKIIENGFGKGLRTTLLNALATPFLQSGAMGALPSEYAATMPDIQGGEYIGPDGWKEIRGYPSVVPMHPQIPLEPGVASRLWAWSEKLTAVVYL